MKEFSSFLSIKTGVRTIKEGSEKVDILCVYPTWRFEGADIMRKGGKFYAVLDRSTGLWSKKESTVQKIVDDAIRNYIREKYPVDGYGIHRNERGLAVVGEFINDSESGRLYDFQKWFNNLPPDHNYIQLDEDLTFKSTEVQPDMYRSMRLPYDVVEGSTEAYDSLVGRLYDEENRQKLEWAVGSILAGDSKTIDKMIVIYGRPGKGKGTFLKIIEALFKGYYTTFKADALASGEDQFATSAFKDNPLVAIQEDGTLKRINSPAINEIVSHEITIINDKGKSRYSIRPNAMLFVATNDFVDFHDTKIGMTRRLIDVYPSSQILDPEEYWYLFERAKKFELGAIAYHCLEVYKKLGKLYFNGYTPDAMIRKTNLILNFLDSNLEEFSKQEFFTTATLYAQFREYCKDQGYDFAPKRLPFDEVIKDYFGEYYARGRFKDRQYRGLLLGLKVDKILGIAPKVEKNKSTTWIELKEQPSVLDELYSERPAQYAKEDGNPKNSWSKVKTKLKDIDTHKLHWVSLPPETIRIDFDKRGPDGKKSLEENLKAAAVFPPTYCEVSKSGGGLHLYYIYNGDVTELSRLYEDEVEIKVVSKKPEGFGVNPDRRLLTLCNNLPVATLSDGLPLKEVKKVVNTDVIMTEKGIRATILKCLAKEVHPDTTSNVDFIFKVLEDAYSSGLIYDVSDLYSKVYVFAANATNQSEKCLDKVRQMHFSSVAETPSSEEGYEEDSPTIIFDIEVFPNLLLVCWCYASDNPAPVTMINPSAEELSDLFGLNRLVKPKIIGFNNRSYDNHIVYGRIMGDSIYECYLRSQKIINGGDKEVSNGAKFREAYNLSYADIYDYSSEKMSLKKWEIKLDIHHLELGLDWDQPVPEELWQKVALYCQNDVLATLAVYNACKGDLIVRQVLADISGLTVNDTNRQHITKILVGNEKKPNHIYTNLATGVSMDMTGMPVPTDPNIKNDFPGYEFKQDEKGKWINWYRGTDVGRGGYVYAQPGMYTNVALLDVGNMHGASILALNKFNEHTKNYEMIRNARMAIKHRDYDAVSKMFDGKFMKYLTSDEMADRLQSALKLILNSTYGIAAASFDNPLKDPRDKNNIIALRGALFMRTLQDEVTKRGFKVIHIKTDSIKIPDATPEIIEYVMNFGRLYGYEFEHEATYERICLVNDAVYIAKYDSQGIRNKGGKHAGEWTATGAEFQQPYVFKTLFSKEPIIFKDKCETKSCNSALVLDYNENLPEGEHDYHFVGKVGQFCPMQPGAGGGILYRKQDDKYYAASGTTGYRWLESELVKSLGKEALVDESYYRVMVDKAIDHINEFGDFEWFVNGDIEDDSYLFDVA